MDAVYVPSRATGSELIDKGIPESKIRLYPRGINTRRFHPAKRNGFWHSSYRLTEQELKLLYVGRISKEKSLDVLVQAFKRIEKQVPHTRLILVGDGPYRREMQKELKGARVLFTGEITGEALAQAYASSDLFIFPSSTDTFGNVVLEAQASGIPVVVTDKGGPKENLIDGQSGVVVPAESPQAIADAVSRLCSQPERLSRMKQAARAYMENRSFDAAFLKTWELYKETTPATKPSDSGFSFEQLLSMAS